MKRCQDEELVVDAERRAAADAHYAAIEKAEAEARAEKEKSDRKVAAKLNGLQAEVSNWYAKLQEAANAAEAAEAAAKLAAERQRAALDVRLDLVPRSPAWRGARGHIESGTLGRVRTQQCGATCCWLPLLASA